VPVVAPHLLPPESSSPYGSAAFHFFSSVFLCPAFPRGSHFFSRTAAFPNEPPVWLSLLFVLSLVAQQRLRRPRVSGALDCRSYSVFSTRALMVCAAVRLPCCVPCSRGLLRHCRYLFSCVSLSPPALQHWSPCRFPIDKAASTSEYALFHAIVRGLCVEPLRSAGLSALIPVGALTRKSAFPVCDCIRVYCLFPALCGTLALTSVTSRDSARLLSICTVSFHR